MPRHEQTKEFAYRPEQLYKLVTDVARYPEFLPWCLAAEVQVIDDHEILAELTIGYSLFREKYTSRVRMSPPQKIDVQYTQGPFKHLYNHWRFEPTPNGCMVHFFVEFEFKSFILDQLMGRFFMLAVEKMVSAFEKRAHDLYGPPQGVEFASS